ncbi:MAG: aspartate aminotransferase family protein [Gemmatimonadetes bacterium]|nr:aspartate aminotransferase family protein [Gemmatimonadota bacterium]
MPTDSAHRDLAERLSGVESRNVTFLRPPPPFWTDAEGATVRDAAGNTYLDCTGAFGVALAGHRHPLVAERIAAQASRLIHGMGDIHPPAVKVEFLEALAALMPWPDTRGILGLSGSDAVEAALKTAQLATGRHGIIAFEGSYHGLTLGALATTHREHFRRPFTNRLARHVHFVGFPSSTDAAGAVLREIDALLSGDAAVPVGAVLVEPIQGRAGVRIPPSGFLAQLVDRTRAAGALFIADEIFTGMGRTGELLACDHDRVVPDLVCLGKALGGGMPLSACCGPRGVMDAWPASSGEAVHTSTFQGHPLGCAAGLGFLAVLEAEGLVGRARRLGAFAADYLTAKLAGREEVREVRGRGLMLGVELRGPGTARMGPAAAVAKGALDRGLIVLPAGARGDVVELTPPATISEGKLEAGLEVLVSAITTGATR